MLETVQDQALSFLHLRFLNNFLLLLPIDGRLILLHLPVNCRVILLCRRLPLHFLYSYPPPPLNPHPLYGFLTIPPLCFGSPFASCIPIPPPFLLGFLPPTPPLLGFLSPPTPSPFLYSYSPPHPTPSCISIPHPTLLVFLSPPPPHPFLYFYPTPYHFLHPLPTSVLVSPLPHPISSCIPTHQLITSCIHILISLLSALPLSLLRSLQPCPFSSCITSPPPAPSFLSSLTANPSIHTPLTISFLYPNLQPLFNHCIPTTEIYVSC
ncbi:unnamed protein product [Acanthosepion pharaonis]|uniref:Uncharacterized protein n=1 Tax=Acanthosepion pharaonis TaxID=158019 RepID=A0A812DZE7_ACAPH|nr:unnamed protein product [Sepia pharaonis]